MGLSSKQVSEQIGHLDIPSVEVNNQQQQQKQKRPLLKCPRCESTNTKFCYYNNYSKLQPRHFCRACKRHWTEGGTLRKVPVGGCRRNKRPRTSSSDDNHSNDNSNCNNQQQQSAGPFTGDIDTTAIFPDIFRQLLFQPQPQPQTLLPSSQLLMPEIGGTDSFSPNSNSSLYTFKGQEIVNGSEENTLLNLMDGYNNDNGGCWLQDSLAQPSNSFWNCWDGMMDFDASEIKLSTPHDQSLI